MSNERNKIYLAALLHDVGKFLQRGDKPFKKSDLDEHNKRILDYVSPNFGYHHVLWTSQFFDNKKVESVFKRFSLLDVYTAENKDDNNIGNLAVYHHNPQNKLQRIITVADHWSSGMDRAQKYDGYTEKEHTDFRDIRLVPIFQNLKIQDFKNQTSNFEFSLNSLNIETEEHFPKTGLNDNYKTLIDNFWLDFNCLANNKNIEIEAFTDTLLYLLRKYLWCVPASGMKTETHDVSLYDHLKTTAAIAICLYDFVINYNSEFFRDTKITGLDTFLENESPLLFFCADLSGIQKFIYNISSAKAAVSMKGRSFYLQMLLDALMLHITRKCELYGGNIVYSSGGKFYMLLPNTETIIKELEKIEKTVVEEIFAEHHGDLFVCMDWVKFGYRNKKDSTTNKYYYEIHYYNDIDENEPVQRNNLGDLWKTLAEKTGRKKQQKFKDVLIDDFDKFFKPEKIDGESIVCDVTGRELKKGEAIEIKELSVSPEIKKQIKIGEVLKDSDIVVFYAIDKDKKRISKTLQPINLPIGVYLTSSDGLSTNRIFNQICENSSFVRVLLMNKTDIFKTIPELKRPNVSLGFSFYGGNEQAMHPTEKRPYNFEELAGDENAKFRRLGILRMDVDNLGSIFQYGIAKERQNLASYSTLSSMLDLFFSGYLNTIRNNFKDHVNILYSGGDDIFAVGRWDMIIEFAEHVRNDFRRFVCNREEISISAGIALVGAKFPIAKGADMAGDAEKMAKSYKVSEKNAINLFGENVSWEVEFEFVKEIKDKLVRFISNGLSRSILHKLQLFKQIKDKHKSANAKSKKPDFSYRWNTAYFFGRLMPKEDTELKTFLNEMKIELMCNQLFKEDRFYDICAIAARWAEFELRMKS